MKKIFISLFLSFIFTIYPGFSLNACPFLNSSSGTCLMNLIEKCIPYTIPDTTITQKEESKIEGLPILMYDTDIGTGYGVKLFFLNQLNTRESFDLILFNSSKGERWYRLVYSIPDFELRQYTVFPFALDLIIDYDKMIKNGFYGIGNKSKYEDQEFYTKEPLSVSLNLSRSLTPSLVARIGVKYESVLNTNFEEESRLQFLSPELNNGRSYYTSLSLSLKSDTRDSYVNPSKGMMVNGEIEFANLNINSNVNFIRWGSSVNYYMTISRLNTIIALRGILQGVSGENLPIQTLISLGGTNTLRGSALCRLTDKYGVLLNAEARFPLIWRFGALLGIDAGNVFPSLGKIEMENWHINPTVGLRFYMDTFVVRLDIGLGKETTGFYFNFGHLF